MIYYYCDVMKKLNKIYLMLSIFLLVLSFFLKPLIKCNDFDLNIYRYVLLSFAAGTFLSAIFTNIKGKCYKFFSILFFILGIISSCYIYTMHNTDYKNKNIQYLKSVFSDKIINNSVVDGNNILKVSYIDVKQGDATFIEFPNGKVMLIDAGKKDQGINVINYIKNLGYNKIDYVVGTHPDSDHIGGLQQVIENFEIGSIYMPKKSSNTKTYLNLLKSIKNKNLNIITAKKDVVILENPLTKIIAPVKDYKDSNDSSAVIKIIYHDRSFLFMGDASVKSESDIDDVSADVVKIGHHGSKTSSSINFIKRTRAKYAIVSVGKNNMYHHPNEQVLNNWTKYGAEILRTDEKGNIIIVTDGYNIEVQ